MAVRVTYIPQLPSSGHPEFGASSLLLGRARRSEPGSYEVAVRQTPSATAASATRSATSGPTRVSNTDGTM